MSKKLTQPQKQELEQEKKINRTHVRSDKSERNGGQRSSIWEMDKKMLFLKGKRINSQALPC